MPAASECPSAKQVSIGYCSAHIFNSATHPTTSPTPPNASAAQIILKPSISPSAISATLQQKTKCSSYSPAQNSQNSPPTPNKKSALPASVKQKKARKIPSRPFSESKGCPVVHIFANLPFRPKQTDAFSSTFAPAKVSVCAVEKSLFRSLAAPPVSPL